MSQENVEIIRAAIDAATRGDWEGALKDVAPDVELDTTEPQVGGAGVRPGFDASRKALLNYWETFEDFHAEIEEVIHADKEQVVARVRDSGRLSGSDSEISNRFFEVWTFREGKIVRVSIHTDRNRALEAAGLSE
jgi:ketosteroid isomerase-like protein